MSPSRNREMGPMGTAARVAGGLAAVVIPVALGGISWWDAGAAFLLLPATAALAAAAITAIAIRRGATGGVTEAWLRSTLVLVIVIAVEVAVTFVTPLDGATAIFLFIGVSLLIAALRGDAACEAVAIPNALTGRRDRTGCVIYAPVDAFEARRSAPA